MWLARADSVQPCGAPEAENLSPEHVTVSEVDQGLFQGSRKFAVRCGSWSAEAICNRQESRIALQIEGLTGEPVPEAPAALAFRLYAVALERLFAKEGRAGHSGLSVRRYAELGDRMAEAAAQSSGWDLRRGRPRSGLAVAFVRDLLNDRRLYSEVADLSHRFGYEARATSVENVWLCPVRQQTGLAPCGAQVGFELFQEGRQGNE